mmetsp:Transcript_6211/g.9327  ORF Transcript_6211/g.9327 Transcript_6211/m.9327 type:complete len:239 (-) Transcript_6211:474-1190(-)
MQLKVRSIIFKVIIVGYFIGQIHIETYRCLIGPAPCHITNGISSSTQHQGRHIETLGIPHTLRMALQTQIKTPQSISRQRVRTTLQHNRTRLKHLHNLIHHRFKYPFIRLIRHPTRQWSIDRKSRPLLGTRILNMPRPRKEIPILVQTKRHDPIRTIKCLLDSIPMMDININIQHSRMHLEQFQYGQYNIINITKSRSLTLLGMMEPPTPINGNIAIPPIQFDRSIQRGTRIQLRKFI